MKIFQSFLLLLLVLTPLFYTQVEAKASSRRTRELILDILKSFGGSEMVGELLDGFTESFEMLQRSTELIKSLNNKEVLESINFFFNSLITNFHDVIVKLLPPHELPKGHTLIPEDFKSLLEEYTDSIIKALETKPAFPSILLAQLKVFFPEAVETLYGFYSQFYTATGGRGFTNGMMIQAAELSRFLRRDKYVDDKFFDSVVNIPDEMLQKMDDIITQFVPSDRLEMIASLIKMMKPISDNASRKSSETTKKPIKAKKEPIGEERQEL